MKEWQELILSEITEPVKSTYIPKRDEQLAYIGLEHIEQQTLRLTGVGKSSDVTSNKFKFGANDVLFGKLRPYFRKVYKPKFSGICSTDIWVFRAKKGFSQDFLFYFLANRDFVDTANSGEGGTRMPRADWNFLKITNWLVPCEEEQKTIASVLSSLDDKIDLLHRQNTTLERMAETLFRQWFVEEVQEDWEELPLGEVATVQNGYAFSSSDYVEFQEGFLEVFKMGHIQPGGGLRFAPKADFVPRTDKLKRWVLNKNDIVMAMTDMKDNMGILGHPALVDISNKYALNQRVARIHLENSSKLNSIYLVYLQLSTEEAISLLQSKANSGVQVNLTTEAIKSIPITIPPTSIQNRVLETIQPIFIKLNMNRSQIQTLEKLRDTLLPKLMSGEVRVALPSKEQAA